MGWPGDNSRKQGVLNGRDNGFAETAGIEKDNKSSIRKEKCCPAPLLYMHVKLTKILYNRCGPIGLSFFELVFKKDLQLGFFILI